MTAAPLLGYPERCYTTQGAIPMLNPALQRHLFEAHLIGQLVLAYGELEMMVAVLLGNAMGNRSPAFKMMFRIVGESARIGAADAMMRDKYSEVGLETEYAEAIASVRFCVGVRNQFAHCHWGDDIHAGLFFTNLQEPAKATDSFEYYWKHIDVPLAQSLFDYFEYTLDCLRFLELEYLVKREIRQLNFLPKPSKLERPNLHNPPDLHIPPWLSEDERQQHIGRALAAQGGAPTPTPKQLDLQAAREAKRARRQADQERDLAKRSDPDSQR